MRSLSVIGVFAALIAVTLSSESTPTVPIGYLPSEQYETTLEGEVLVGISRVGKRSTVSCKLQGPDGEEYDLNEVLPEGVTIVRKIKTNGSEIKYSCGIRMIVSTVEHAGEWMLTAEESLNRVPLEERRLKFTIHIGEPLSSEVISSESALPIEYLPSEQYETTLKGEVLVGISRVGKRSTVSCKLQGPDGEEYDLNEVLPEGVTIVRKIKTNGSEVKYSCGIRMIVSTVEHAGEWMLTAEESLNRVPLEERKLNFTIFVAEHINTSPRDEATVAEGNDFYLRLESPVDPDVKCHVEGPDVERVEVDTRFEDNCAFVIRNARESDSGTWTIVHGDFILYKAAVVLTVDTAPASTKLADLDLTRDRMIDQTIGPDNAVYCTLQDPSGFSIYSGFGQCHLTLNRVKLEHEGIWTLKAALPGWMLMNEYQFQVNVVKREPKPTVEVMVDKQQPAVTLSCVVSSPKEVRTCQFRDPTGKVLIASEGIGDGRYTFFGNGTRHNNGIYTHDCGLKISSAETSDLGLWRCAMETDEEKYFGFLTVLCPWAMSNPEVAAAVVSEPVLATNKKSVSVLDGETVTLGCHVPATIRYCYFRARNGTIFSVGPETSTDRYSYSGAGFDAGECGITFNTFNYNDGGAWSCHVGFVDTTQPEQRDAITVSVADLLSVNQYAESSVRLMVVAQAYEQRALDYCRFVRIDGLGFTDITPNDAKTINDLSTGICRLRIRNPTILDHHPWTVVARVKGHPEEITGVTRHTIGSEVPNPHPEEDEKIPDEEEVTKPENEPKPPHHVQPPHPDGPEDGKPGQVIIYYVPYRSVFYMFFIVLSLVLLFFFLVNNSKREVNNSYKSGFLGNSFRRVFRRSPVEDNGAGIPDAVIISNEIPKKQPLY